jgi:hypothetical protein
MSCTKLAIHWVCRLEYEFTSPLERQDKADKLHNGRKQTLALLDSSSS